MESANFPVVGIGASAGGIEAFRLFFENMPAECGMAFVVILHLPPGHNSLLGDILSRCTTMPVVEATDGTRLEADHVYVPPSHTLVSLSDGHLQIRNPPESNERIFRPIDGFFDSLGSVRREQAVGIILSGTGTDGALGLKAIKACGGVTIAQGSDGTSPQYEGMPGGAIATGAVDLVSSVEDIPGHLLRLKSTKAHLPDGRRRRGDPGGRASGDLRPAAHARGT